MSDIIKNNEVLEDSDLDEVAGGVVLQSVDQTGRGALVANRDPNSQRGITRNVAAGKVPAKDRAKIKTVAESKHITDKMHVKSINRNVQE